MGMRPVAAQWFEILTPREDLTRALRCLAGTGAVELQTHSQATSRAQLPDLHHGLDEYSELSRRYGDWWPAPAPQPVETAAEPAEQLRRALEVLEEWAKDAAPVIAELQNTRRMRHDLETLRRAVSVEDGGLPDLHQLAASGPYLAGRLYEVPMEAVIEQVPPSVLLQPVRTETERFLFAVGVKDQIEMLDEYLSTLKARPLELPRWLPGTPEEAVAAIDQRVEYADKAVQRLENSLREIHEKHGLADALGRLRLLDWYVTHVPELPVTERFAWITGWTNDPDATHVDARLHDSGINYLLRLGEPPADVARPMVLRNPPWARPFELFAALLGTPGDQDVDPSRIVAFLAPLMFGYMFGDVGQGAVLLTAGLLLRKKLPVLGLLVPGGISAIIFGFVFGSVFGSEEIIPALWVHPIEEPLPVLAASLIFGFLVVTLGLALDAHQCHWRGDDMEFWGARLGLPMTYFGILFAIVFTIVPEGRLPIQPAWGIWYAMLGTVWFIAGYALRARPNALPAAGNAAGEYIETVLQLLVNTISFVRVGAFALAHGGLSAAIVGMADSVESLAGKAAVMTLGNALIIGLEGLVVSIQTTRLVLFEFFIRFLRSSARSFKPLPTPDDEEPGKQRRES
jgi:V/A-type H+-transporting ATPase subunit I